MSDRGGRPQVWVQPVDGRPAALVDLGDDPVTAVRWSSVGGWLACQVAPGGAPRHEVWLVRPDGSAPHQVAGFGSDTAENIRWLPGRPLLAVTENLATALLIDPVAGSRTEVTKGELIALLDVSPDRSRALLRIGPRGARRLVIRDLTTETDHYVTAGEQAVLAPDAHTVYARSESSEFPILTRTSTDTATRVAGADPESASRQSSAADNHGICQTRVLDWAPPRGWGRSAGAGEPRSRKPSSDGAEVESFALTSDGTAVAVLWNVRGGESEVEIIDLRSGGRRLLSLPGSVVSGLEWSFDGSALAFAVEGPGRPLGVWVFDGTVRAVSATPAEAGAVGPTLETFAAHDGLGLSGWLYRPAGVGPHPTVISLHGGPEAQERPGHAPLYQALLARGIAVFAPNVRGSSGFGRSFVNADNGSLRYRAIEDVRSSVRHLVDSGISEKSGIGCMGRSYGGYLTLAALTSFPDLFAVGVDVCGMSNFSTFYRDTEPWIAAAAVSKYGDPELDAAMLADLSPINHIARLRAPLLVVHGANDTNVPVIEAEQVVAALAARGVPHRYLLFPAEGHEFLHRSARAEYLRETVDWLATYLRPETGRNGP